MDFFGRQKRKRERAEMQAHVSQMQIAVTKLSARLNCAEAFILAIIAANDTEQKEIVFGAAKKFATQLGPIYPPDYVPKGNEQVFRDELSRALQVFIEIAPEISN